MMKKADLEYVEEVWQQLVPSYVPPPKRKAEVLAFPPLLNEWSETRRQRVLDCCKRTLEAANEAELALRQAIIHAHSDDPSVKE